MFVGALLVFQRLETNDESSGSIRPDSEVALLYSLHQSTASGCQAGRLGTAVAAQSTRSERAQSAQARSATTLTDAGTLAPDFLPLGIGLFIINTRDVVTCEDAPKAFVTNLFPFVSGNTSLLIKRAFGRSCSNSKTTGMHSLSQTGSRKVDPIYRSPIPFLNFNSSSESPSSLDAFDKD